MATNTQTKTPASRAGSLSAAIPSAALVLVAAILALGAAATGLGGSSIAWAGGALAANWWQAPAVAALYTLPGLALLTLFWPRDLALATRLALAAPLSAALPPLLLLLTRVVGLRWGAAATWCYLALSLAVCLWSWRSRPRPAAPAEPGFPALAPLLGLTAAGLLARLAIVRELPTGLLGDSYHHTLIAQLLVDNGGLFRSWEPYAPLTTLTYHFGFHANAAFFHWLTGAPVPASVVWSGQVLNALTIPAAFALTVVALRGSAWAGLWAALITGFVLTIPAHYVVWGRYTQLTGQLVLVAAVACWARLADAVTDDQEPRTKNQEPTIRRHGAVDALQSFVLRYWSAMLLAAITTAAMVLTHYLVTVFAALFAGSYLLARVLERRSWPAIGRLALAGAAAGILALLLTGPWIAELASGYLVRNAAGFSNGEVDAARAASYSALPLATPLYAKSYVLLGALAGLLVGLWRRDWRAALPALWAALLVLAVVPQVLGLPGSGAIDHLTGLSALYLPLAPLAGSALAALQDAVGRLAARLRTGAALTGGLASLALLALIAWGAAWQTRLIDGSTQLVAPADVPAMAWLREHTPATARVLVNGFPAYGGTLVAGSDAGWWLPLLAGRATTLPPITYGSERGPSDHYAWDINLLYRDLRGRTLADARPIQVDITTPEAIERLRAAGVTHVYSGATASPPPAAADHIDIAKLRASPAFRLVYERDGVTVFELLPPADQ